MNYYVYEWYIIETNEVFYVGKGKDERAEKLKNNKFFMDMYNSHNCNFRIMIDNLSEEEAFDYEKRLIKYYREVYPEYRLTNQTDGGEGTSGWHPSEEWKENQSVIHKQIWENEDYRNKMIEIRNSDNSVYKTEEFRNKISEDRNLHVEQIQDVVEMVLMENKFYETAKHYIEYRQKHSQRRSAQKHLIQTYKDMLFADATDVDLKRDNANINTDAPMGIMLKLGTESSKYFINNFVLKKEYEEADRTNHIHIHDKDFSLITMNCCQIDLLKLFHGGFSTGHGFLREPNSIRAYASLACIAIQSNQNDMFQSDIINVNH